MKLLLLKATGLPLFKGEMEMTFFARQRVDDADKDVLLPMNPGSRYYLNSTNAIVGINASGKTSVLKVVLLVLDIINNKPINNKPLFQFNVPAGINRSRPTRRIPARYFIIASFNNAI